MLAFDEIRMLLAWALLVWELYSSDAQHGFAKRLPLFGRDDFLSFTRFRGLGSGVRDAVDEIRHPDTPASTVSAFHKKESQARFQTHGSPMTGYGVIITDLYLPLHV